MVPACRDRRRYPTGRWPAEAGREILGWCWLLPPYQWTFGAITAGPVGLIEFDAAMVRSRGADDPELGYDLTQRLLRVLAHRLQATRVKLVTGAVAVSDRLAR